MHYTLLANKLGALATLVADVPTIDGQSQSTAAALLTLHYHGPLMVTGLAAILGLSQPAASRLLDRLVSDRLATRSRRPGARETLVDLTPGGRKIAEQAQTRRLERLQAVLAPLSTEQRQVLEQMLDAILALPIKNRDQARHLCRFCDHSLCDGAACPVGSAARRLESRQRGATP